jgi:hypothetical protein
MKEPNRVRKNEIKAINQIQLNEEQKEAKRLIIENQIVIITGRAGSGKAQSLKSKIVTPDGLTTMGAIKVGDSVINEHGNISVVTHIHPQGLQKIYKITFSDGSTTECTSDHLWNVCSRANMNSKFLRTGKENTKYQKYETLTLEQILKKGIKIGKTNKNKWFIPITQPINFNTKELKIDPYILGCLLGDGNITHDVPYITNEDEEIINYFQEWCNKNGLVLYNTKNKSPLSDNFIHYSITSRKNQEPIEINTLTKYLREYNLMGCNSFNKFIPKEYLYNSLENRIALLQGLMDTDGWIQISKFKTNKGHSSQPYYSTVSEQLKDDFIFLIQSLGGVCYVTEKQGKYKAKGEKEYKLTATNYRICVNLPNEIRNQIFKLNRKKERITPQLNILNRTISDIEYIGEDLAQCITIDSPTQLYLTDNCIVTHNSLIGAQAALDFLLKKQVADIKVTRAAIEVGRTLGFLPGELSEKYSPYIEALQENLYKCYDKVKVDELITQGKIKGMPVQFIRGKTIDDILIVEEAQNLTKHEMLAILTRLGKVGKIIINGDNEQTDIKTTTGEINGLSYAIELSKKIEEIKWIKLKENHRSDLVGKILDYEYEK